MVNTTLSNSEQARIIKRSKPQTKKSNVVSSCNTTTTSSSFSSSYCMLLTVKILLVIIILFWLPPLVISKKRTNRRNRNDIKTTKRRVHRHRWDCEIDCLELSYEYMLPAEESMNCIFHCMSPTCFQEIYRPILEPGEVDILRYELFEKCLEEEIRQERRQRATKK
jgi:Domain of unknown function (DUF4787)